MKNKQTALQQKLSQPAQLPAIAKNIHVLMQALANDDLNFLQLTEIIKHYPEITARLIFLANSSWSAPISPINNIEHAISRLGVSIVKSVSIAISIASSFDTRRCPCFDTVHFWTSSMLAAEGAGLLASKLPQHNVDIELEQTAQTAGLLHNLGLLWLADNLPSETDTALQRIYTEPSLSVNESLRLSIDTDYCKIGGWIANQLKLPKVLIAAMEYHRTPHYQESSKEIVLIVGEATRIASALHKQAVEISSNTDLENLGIDSSAQAIIFQQLADKFENTQQLAQSLFKG